MTDLAEEARQHRAALEDRVAALDASARAIAAALAAPPPRNRARLEALLREIGGAIGAAQPLFLAIQRAHGDASRRAGEEMPGGRLPQDWYDLASRAGLVRVALNQWPRIETMVRRQVAEPRRKLNTAGGRPDMAAARDTVADAVFAHLHRILNPLEQDANAAGQGAYGDIGYPQSRFVSLAHAAYRVCLAQGLGRTRFLDVGCGLGLKLLGAARFFDAVAGVELDPGYAARARSFLDAAQLADARVVQCGAAEFDEYDAFDVVYIYRPIEDDARMAALEAGIAARLSPGTLVAAPYGGMEYRHRDLGLRPLAPELYVSGLDRAEVSRLRRRAEYIGPAIRPPADPLPSVLTPILRVSHANGFDIARETQADNV